MENKTEELLNYQVTGNKLNIAQILVTAAVTAVLTAVVLGLLWASGLFSPSERAAAVGQTELQALVLPGEGGSIRIEGETKVTFTPDTTGLWEISTSENFDSDPRLVMVRGEWDWIGNDDDSGEGLNAFLSVFLNAGETYTIHALFFANTTGSYTLTASRPEVLTLAPGEETEFEGATSYIFTPTNTGFWHIAAHCQEVAPTLTVLDREGNGIAWGENALGGASPETQLTVFLTAGETYLVQVDFYDRGMSSIKGHRGTLRARPAQVEQMDASGGGVWVPSEVIFAFTPRQSGNWRMFTSNREEGVDPMLAVYGVHGMIIMDDDSAGDLNAEFIVYLEAGETYWIRAHFFGGGMPGGGYLLTVVPFEEGFAHEQEGPFEGEAQGDPVESEAQEGPVEREEMV